MSIPDIDPCPCDPNTDTTACPDTAGSNAAAPSWTWVPIRSLGPRHRGRITAHLIALTVGDRYLRFGYPATDAQISKYVDMLDFEQDEVFGIFSRRLELIALAHLAHTGTTDGGERPTLSEFGVSVLPQARSRGFGRRLFEHAMLHARNRGVETLFIHALSENTAMLKIARNAGATVIRAGSESDASLKLPPDTLGSHVGELVEQQAAELDYQFKVRAHQVGGILNAIGELKNSMNKATHVAEE
jgi:ribosomal protein S18 acetylase RimI-like enzyme